jgi:hypothetical protein
MKKYIIVPPRRKNKKYSVLKYNSKTKEYDYLLSFGSALYQHYEDKTPLKLWSHLNHNDKERRKRYYQRHGTTDDEESAKYYSNKYLW